ncbi:MAG: DegT/DnrJ/EryC1/StrS aminotransferase family protein [Deltaproteobacteria bacterium]|nr:DegT/DnrJ/EryC1/StrS aminotransferase family protein [Deltaproteobacteria bacterium]
MFDKREDFLPFSKPSFDRLEEEEIISCLRSGWITTGPRCQALEKAFAAKLGGGARAVAVNSGTAALHLALLALGVGPGQDVLTSSFTWVSTANVIVHVGAGPVLADIDPRTFNLDPAAVERVIAESYQPGPDGRPVHRTTGRTLTTLLPVHYAGQACDMAPLLELARAHRLDVVEDAAHAVGTTYQGVPAGRLGRVGCFSFYANKNLTTGEGGMVTAEEEALIDRVRMFSLHGLDKGAWKRYAKDGQWYQVIHEPGFKYNLTDIAASLGLHQLAKVEGFNVRRRELAAIYDQELAKIPGLRLSQDLGLGVHARHLYPIVVTPAAAQDRAAVIRGLGELNVGTGVHYVPVHLHPYYQEAHGFREGDFPETEAVYQGEISLPLFPTMSDDDARYVGRALAHLLGAA